jgi:hypothetical protein
MAGRQRQPRGLDIFRRVNSVQHDVISGGRETFGDRVAEASA